jgi:hypothetical protein
MRPAHNGIFLVQRYAVGYHQVGQRCFDRFARHVVASLEGFDKLKVRPVGEAFEAEGVNFVHSDECV